MTNQEQLRSVIVNTLAKECHENAVKKGFWEKELSDGELIALIHSELSEALEASRTGNPKDPQCPMFSNLEIELADTIIRILDLCAARRFNIGGALLAKMAFNQTRPYKHGKEY